MASVFTSQTPTSGNVSEPGGISLGMTFIADADGSASGMRFYASSSVGGTYTGQLYQVTSDDDPEGSGTGTLLASAALGGAATPSAWNEITFPAPVDITAGVPYRVVYHNTDGHYVSTPSFAEFVSGGLTNGHLTAVAAGTEVGFGSVLQGVFRTGGAAAYPSNYFNNSNYFADIIYTADPVPPGQGQAAFSLGLAVATTGDAPGVDPGKGQADYGLDITLAAIGETPGAGSGTAAFSFVLGLATAGAAELPRAIAPSEGSRLVYAISSGLTKTLQGRPNTSVTIYADGGAVSLADIRTLAGDVIPGSVLVTDEWSQLPLFRMPEGADTVWARVAGGPLWPVYAREDDRLDTLESDVDQLQIEVRQLEAEVVPGLAADVTALQTEVAALDGTVSLIEDFVDIEVGVVRPEAGATGYRPDPEDAGAGAMWFDVTLGKPIWSDGTDWVDATGATV